MLALSRKLGERIIINGNIVIEVSRIKGNKVVLGIEAPKEISIHRQEVFDAIQKQKPAA